MEFQGLKKTSATQSGQSLFTRCSSCGFCCKETEMMLSDLDIECLERAGHDRQEFVRFDRQGFAKLRNRSGCCYFYDAEKRRCRVYEHRPLGCRTYPVVYSEEEGIVVDELCPMRGAVSRMELRRKGRKVIELLKRVDDEAASRRETT